MTNSMKSKVIYFGNILSNYISLLFYNVLYFSAKNGIIHILSKINVKTGAELPCEYVWGERYLNRIEYLRRRSQGIKCTYQDVENEFLDDWNKRFQEARMEFEEYRKNNPIDGLL